MASIPLMTGIMGGFVISEGYRYIYSWFSGDHSSERNTSITINIGDTTPKTPSIKDTPVMLPSNDQLKLFEQLEGFDVSNLKSVKNKENDVIEYDVMDELRLKISDRRNKLLCE